MGRKRSRRRVHRCSLRDGALTVAQERYVLAATEAAQVGKLLPQKEPAAIARVSEQSISRWKRSDAFNDEVNRASRRALSTAWLEAEHASATRAKRGSLLDWRLYVESGGPTSWNPTGAPAGIGPDCMHDAGGGVHVHVHGIPERQPMSTLPPPLTLPASPSTPSAAPNAGSATAARPNEQ